MSSSVASQTSEPLRILIVTQYFWPENFQINHLARALQARGHQITVLTDKPNYPTGRFFPGYSMLGRNSDDYNGIAVIRAPLIRRGNGARARLALNYLSFAMGGMLVAWLRLKPSFDCIFVYEPSPITVGLPALAARQKTGAAILFWVQDLWPESVVAAGGVRASALLYALRRMVTFIYRRCARILIQSRAFRSQVVEAGADDRKVIYWPQSVDALFRPVAPAADAPPMFSTSDFRIVFGGNIGHAQDFETVLDAAELLRHADVHWIIVGDGRRREWLAAQIERRGLNERMQLTGPFPEEAMPGLFAHADALLVTLRDEPIFALTIPTKVQAYMACGKPLIAMLNGEGARLVSEAQAGLVAPAGNAAALAAAISRLAAMAPGERAIFGENGLAYSNRNFDRDTLVDQLVGLMREVAAERQGQAG